MKSLKEFNKTGNEFQLLDEQTQQELVEIFDNEMILMNLGRVK